MRVLEEDYFASLRDSLFVLPLLLQQPFEHQLDALFVSSRKSPLGIQPGKSWALETSAGISASLREVLWRHSPQSRYAVPLGPKLLHYITLSLWINFPDSVIIICITKVVSKYFLGFVILALLQSIPCGYQITLHNCFRINLPVINYRMGFELRFRRARTGHKNPPRPEIRKNYEKNTKSPTPGWALKIRKNYRKNTKMPRK